MINGINHITLAVSNLEKSICFYTEVLGLKLKGKWHKGAYLLAGEMWIALNLDENRVFDDSNDYTHIAFNTSKDDFNVLKEKLEQSNVITFKENLSEGASYYFLDPDGHKLELHYNTLEDRLKWAKESNWSDFEEIY